MLIPIGIHLRLAVSLPDKTASQVTLAGQTITMQIAYFVKSGSEANDKTILKARLCTGNHAINSYKFPCSF